MTPRQKFLMALDGKQPPGRVPHFELVFYLTMEAFGRVHPTHRVFGQWGQMSLIGNVNCGLLDTGTDDQAVESARYALKHGMPGGEYVFSTSNCVYTGMDLARYELILDVWCREGNYAG